MYGYIYKTTNKINGKIYVGKKISSAFLGNKYHGSGAYIKNAIHKYGEENFETELLEEAYDLEDLNMKEKYWIKKLNSQDKIIGYNISPGGDGGDTFSQLSPEDKVKRGKKLSDISKGRIAINKNGELKYIHTEDLKRYEDLGWKRGGLKAKEETRKKQSLALSSMCYITDGIQNKRVSKNINMDLYPGFFIGFTPHTKSKEEIKEREKKRHREKEEIFLKEGHYCEKCGKRITKLIGNGRFCSKSCAASHSHTKETKEKLSELNKLGICGMKGKHWTDEQKNNHSQVIKKYYSNPNNKKVWVNFNNIEEKRINYQYLDDFLSKGWVKGSIKGRVTPWNKGLNKADERVRIISEHRNKTMMKKYGTLNTHAVKEMKKKKEEDKL